MKSFLFDIGHPAHVHLFRNVISFLRSKSCFVVVTSRDKDLTHRLLDHYGIEYYCLSRATTSVWGMTAELFKRDVRLLSLHRRFKFRAALGTSSCIAHLTALAGVPSFVFEEDDDAVVPLFSAITYPFATGIVVPECLRFKRWRKKRIIHRSYHELAYLHPDDFFPDSKVPEKYGLIPGKYIIIRHSALQAHHDRRIGGLMPDIMDVVRKELRKFHVVTTRERQKNGKIDPWDMHHVMAYSKLVVSDSQTMTMESACLGVPSIRYNSFVGNISYLEEAERVYDLTYGFRPGEEKQMLRKIRELVATPDTKKLWQEKRDRMIEDKENLSQWLRVFAGSLLA
ncbi:MAG: DUF354 domain-containing protein [Candidatus Aminicenantes bacterium]|nr:DUF354 domain-containing protein [Candidatus Aminicenantes bacterium]